MFQEVKVAVISGDARFSSALCTLFTLEGISCRACRLEEGLTYLNPQSNGCVVLHAETGEIPYVSMAEWLARSAHVVVLSETISDLERQDIERLGATTVKVPVNSRQLLDVIYSILPP